MDICGEARRVTRAHLLEFAAKGGIKRGSAVASLERMLEQVGQFGAPLGPPTDSSYVDSSDHQGG
jgi:hypothetical protein